MWRIGNISAVVQELEPCYNFTLEGKGSSYEDLRVGKPDEYDFGLVNGNWTGKVSREKPAPPKPDFGYARVDIATECLDKFKDSENRLDPMVMRTHLKELVQVAMDRLNVTNESVWEQGPAVSFRSGVDRVKEL